MSNKKLLSMFITLLIMQTCMIYTFWGLAIGLQHLGDIHLVYQASVLWCSPPYIQWTYSKVKSLINMEYLELLHLLPSEPITSESVQCIVLLQSIWYLISINHFTPEYFTTPYIFPGWWFFYIVQNNMNTQATFIVNSTSNNNVSEK